MRHAALDFDTKLRDVRELDRVVGPGPDRLGKVEPNLLLVHVERSDELDVADVIPAQLDVHQAGNEVLGRSIAVVVDALYERGGAVADADDRDADLAVAAAVLVTVFHASTSS